MEAIKEIFQTLAGGLLIVLYFLPTIIALNKPKCKQVGAIVSCNIIFGWTVIGWVIALFWAYTDDTN